MCGICNIIYVDCRSKNQSITYYMYIAYYIHITYMYQCILHSYYTSAICNVHTAIVKLVMLLYASAQGVCPNFGHPALTSSFTKYKFLQMKNSFATIVNGLSVLKLFQLSNGDLCFSQHAYSICKERKTQNDEVRVWCQSQGALPYITLFICIHILMHKNCDHR